MTIPELESLAFRFFSGAVLATKKKDAMIAVVRGLVMRHLAANPLGLTPEALVRASAEMDSGQTLGVDDVVRVGGVEYPLIAK